MDRPPEVQIERETARMVAALEAELAFAAITRDLHDVERVRRGDAWPWGENEMVGDGEETSLVLLRLTAVVATLVCAAGTMVAFGVHVVAGLAALFFMPVLVLAIVLAVEAIAVRIAPRRRLRVPSAPEPRPPVA